MTAVDRVPGALSCNAVLGTHTHVATADEQILPKGTAYQTDVGMTGPYESILGRRIDRVMAATLTFVPHYFDVAKDDPRLCGALIEVDPTSGHALAIQRVAIDQQEAKRLLTESAVHEPAPVHPPAHSP
jgi:2',3'-cyclic-nucleotide 2'-phosphodiesterase